MKRFVAVTLVFILNILFFVSYAQDKQSNAQDQNIVQFDKTIHNFGDILESTGPVECTFTLKNISDKPIAIHNVISSCGCTSPEWTKEPVLPSQKGKIKVVFQNDQGPFPFDKTLTVYISGLNRPIVLRIRGIVHEKKKNINELYTIRIGELGLRKTNYTIGYIDQGRSKSDNADIANLSNNPVKVSISEKSDGLSVTISPNPIPARSTAIMTYSINTAFGKAKWGKTDYYAKFILNGKKYEEKISVKGVIKDNFKSITKEQLNIAPSPFFETSYYEFNEVKQGKIMEHTFVMKNKGKSELIIHKIESEQGGVTILNPMPIKVKAGGLVNIKIKFDTKTYEGEVINILTLITNSPSRPMVNLFITGNVIK
ncbi:MAG: DUF1573 domain-containing protein [Bacteroidales bacterium]|nr:DUF1573 domain-containing protein [Bacteroidales bacterium]